MPQPDTQPSRRIAIEPARLRDLPAVVRIQREAFRPGLAYGRFALLVLWLLPAATVLIARDRDTGAVVGNLIADRYRGNTRVVNIAVARDARRQGIGRQLMRALDTWCPEGDVVLSVEADNIAAQQLYEREGYIRTAMTRDYYGRGRHGYTMKRHRHDAPVSVTAP